MPTMKELVGVAKAVEKTASDMHVVGCQETTRKIIMAYDKSMKKQKAQIEVCKLNDILDKSKLFEP